MWYLYTDESLRTSGPLRNVLGSCNHRIALPELSLQGPYLNAYAPRRPAPPLFQIPEMHRLGNAFLIE